MMCSRPPTTRSSPRRLAVASRTDSPRRSMPPPHETRAATAATRRFTLVIALTIAQGCIALPFATPPVRASFTVSGAFPPRGATLPSPSSDTVTLGARITAHPMGMVPSLLDRPADVGVGYVFDTPPTQGGGRVSRDLHGACLDVSVWPWRDGPERGHRVLRAGLSLRSELLVGHVETGATDVGFGVMAGPEFEFVVTRDGPFSSSGGSGSRAWVAGTALGELGVTASVLGSYRAVGDAAWWSVVFALGFRLPASVGIYIATLR